MDFPNFENNNQNQSTHNTGFYNRDDEIEIDNMEFNNNNYQNYNDNYNPNIDHINYNNMAWMNNPASNVEFSAHNDGLDEVEKKRIEERSLEDEERRAKIMKKMNDELRIKQEFRDKARDFIENWKMLKKFYFNTFLFFNKT